MSHTVCRVNTDFSEEACQLIMLPYFVPCKLIFVVI